MGYADDIQAVMTAVESKVRGLVTAVGALEFPTVIAEYKTPDWDKVEFPVAWIIQGMDRIEPIGGRRVMHNLDVSIIVVNQSPDEQIRPEDVQENRRLVGRVYDSLRDPNDRSLGLPDLVEDVQPSEVDPNFNPRAGRILHWSELTSTIKIPRVE